MSLPVAAKRLQVEHPDTAIFDPDHPRVLHRLQRRVDTLARQAHQVTQLLLGDAQHLTHTGVEHRVEQGRQAAGDAGIGVAQAVDLAGRDELAQALVQLLGDEAVERDAAIDQPMKGVHRDAGDHTLAQGLDVVAVALALDHRALAEPSARRHAGEGDGDALRGVVAHLQQPVEHPEPEGGRSADTAQQFAGCDLHHPQIGHHAAVLVGLQGRQPGNAGQLIGLRRPGAGVQGR